MSSTNHDPIRHLNAAAFLYAFGIGILYVNIPFVIKYFGGSEKELGNAFGFFYAAYLAACLGIVRRLDCFCPKNILLFGTIGTTLAIGGIAALLLIKPDLPVSNVTACTICMIFLGVSQSCFWPALLGWVSQGYDGPALSKRLNIYNLNWISALIISPFAGGFMAEWSVSAAMSITDLMMLLAFVSICLVQRPSRAAAIAASGASAAIENAVLSRSRPFLWMSRIALALSCIIMGLVRTQLALLLCDYFHYSERYFGFTTTAMCVANLIIFFAVTRTAKWHYRYRLFLLAHFLLAAALVLIIVAQHFVWFLIATALVGWGYGFLYSSHQFYGVSGGKKRLALMAIHEIIIAGGLAGGPIIGGYVARAGFYRPYYFGLTAVAAALLAETLIYLYFRRKTD